jgi:hypothetical protein
MSIYHIALPKRMAETMASPITLDIEGFEELFPLGKTRGNIN